VGAQGTADMALPHTPNNQQKQPFPIDSASFPIDPSNALTAKAAAKARQMKGLKRKRKFTRKSAKLEALKENIRMRIIGLGWKQFAITWSQLVDELATHLKMIIREEKRLTPPKDPALEMPKRPELPILGTASQQLIESNATALRLTKTNLKSK